jgi:ABC-type branched-subunit amino acid transport system substrate-binding protein/DNA-binding beta-propeller fold protein YncE
VGSLFAGFVVERRLAAGGMGTVYRARDPGLGRSVALKVVTPELAGDERYRDGFLREARLAAGLEHPGILPVYGFGQSDGRLFLAMRLMEDGALSDRLARSGPISVADVGRLLGPVADALDTAHRAGLVHRDVKPGNILLQGDHAYLADFGLAERVSPGEEALNAAGRPQASGTIGYLAPEQIEGDRADPASDQYGLACVVFECVTGRQPFARDSELAVVYAHLQSPPPSVASGRPDLSIDLDPVLGRGLAKRPQDRFASCRELIDAVAACAMPEPSPTASAASADPGPTRDRPLRWRSRRAVTTAAVLLAATLASSFVVAGVVAGRTGQGTAVGGGDGVVVVDQRSEQVTDRLHVGAGPLAVAAGAGAVWVVNADDHTLSRIDPTGRRTVGAPFAVPGYAPVGLAFGAGALWVAAGQASDKIDFGAVTTAVVRVDPVTGQPGDPIELRPRRNAEGFHRSGRQLTVGAGSVWAIDQGASVERINPSTGAVQVVVTAPGYRAAAISYGGDAVWVLGEVLDQDGAPTGPYIWSINPVTLAVANLSRVSLTGASDLAVGAGSVWVASPWDGLVARVPIGPQPAVRTLVVRGATTVTFDDATARLWVVDASAGTVSAVDAATNTVGRPIDVHGVAQSLVVVGRAVFITVIGAAPQEAVSRPAGSADVHLPGCQKVWGDPETQPDVVIVGDYPMSVPSSRVDSLAVLSVLREHRFRSGRHSVGYQLCNDLDGTTGGRSCADFAKAYGSASRVVAVITGYLSSCAAAQLPWLARAPGGAVAAIGPDNTADQLTAGSFANYVRLTPTDSQNLGAGVGLLAQLKAQRVMVLSEGADTSYITGAQASFQHLAAGRLTVAGTATYRDDGSDADATAGIVDKAGATGVFLIGFPDRATGKMLTALRKHKPAAVVVAPDLLTPVSDILTYSPDAAKGVYVTSTNPPNGALPATGRRWLRRFAATQVGAQVPTSSALSAAAAETLLDAIARSDGTRRTVITALRGTHLTDSIIGPVRFTPDGDREACAISVYQIVGGTFFVPDVQADLQGSRFQQRVECRRRAG